MRKKLNIFDGIKVLSKYILKHKTNFIMFYFGWLIDSILTVITPIIFSIMIDEIVYYKNIGVFLRVSLVFVIMSLFSCALYFFIYAQHQYLMSMYTFDIRLDIFKKMQAIKSSYMSNSKTGDIINTLLNDVTECMHFVIRNIIHPINGMLKGIIYILFIYIISVEAGIVVTIFLPLAVYSTYIFSGKIRTHTDKQRELYGSYVSWLFEILKGLTDIRLLCAQRLVRKDFKKHHKNLFDCNIKTTFSNLISDKVMELINLFIQLSIFGVCAYLAWKGEITIGGVIVLVSFVFTLKDNIIMGLVRSFIDAQSRLSCITRIKQFLAQEDETSWGGDTKLVITHGNIEFNKVKFAYEEDKYILNNLSVHIPAGSHVAVVGKSGCGKSTLISLIIGMNEVKEGRISIDGQDLSQCSLKSIRQSVGIIQQDSLIFDGTIRENLLLGKLKANEDEMLEACKKAGIFEYIDSLPEKLSTIVGKDGINLSGGQKQRLAIARIYLKNPAIIIFDEATSALDSETEQIIHVAWNELLQGRTAIVVAHRLSSVLLCDRAILLENGRVKVSGIPSTLMHENNSFRKLFAITEVYENV